jgi:Tfp pilus assembly protein PilF
MIRNNLKHLLRLYVSPRRAFSEIMDEGSLLFGAIAVIIVSIVLQVGSSGLWMRWITELLTQQKTTTSFSPGKAVKQIDPGKAEMREYDAELPFMPGWRDFLFDATSFSSFLTIIGLAALFVPGALLLVSLTGQVGSFGVVFRRDYGALATCAFMAWTAAHLPLAFFQGVLLLTSWNIAGGFALSLALRGAAFLGFVSLVFIALRLVFPIGAWIAAVSVLGASFLLVLQGCLAVLASPFVLYLAYLYFRSDLRDVQWSLASRRNLKRHLEIATLNPRDADAHYQLGLIHQRRRQWPEAIARFEKAVEIDPSEIDAQFQLGRIARQQNRHADAIRHFGAVVARQPAYSRHEIWREVGGAYFDAGDFAHAREALERFVQNRPYDPEGLYHYGRTLQETGDTADARDALAKCVEAARTAPGYRQDEVRRWRRSAEKALAVLAVEHHRGF